MRCLSFIFLFLQFNFILSQCLVDLSIHNYGPLCETVTEPYGESSTVNNDSSIPNSCEQNVIFPIKILRINNFLNQSNWTNQDIHVAINLAVNKFTNAGIEFNINTDVIDINNNSLLNFEFGNSAHANELNEILKNQNENCEAINIILTNKITTETLPVVGFATFPGQNSNGQEGFIIVSDIGGQSANSRNIIHELGHYFGLFHPFESKFGIDNSGSYSCNKGDLIEDTPGTVTFFQNICFDENNCDYECHNSTFGPQESNIISSNYMSYTGFCQNNFTPFQLRKMFDTSRNCFANICCQPDPPILSYQTNTGNYQSITNGQELIFNPNCYAPSELYGILGENASNTGNCVKWFINNDIPITFQEGSSFSIPNIPELFTTGLSITAYDIPAYNEDCKSDPLTFTVRFIDEPCTEGCSSETPSVSFTNQANTVINLNTDETLRYVYQCGQLTISSGCQSSSWYIVEDDGTETFQNTGATFLPPTELDPMGTFNHVYPLRVYNGGESFDFNVMVIDGGDCYSCDIPLEVIPPSGLIEGGESLQRVNDCVQLTPCNDCGSTDISNYCVFPTVTQLEIRECDPLPTFEALDDCFQWFEADFNTGVFYPDYTNNIEGRFFTPNNINGVGTYYYHLVDIRKSLIEGCGIYLQVNVVECPQEPASISISECVFAGDTETVNWSGVNGSNVRLSMSIDNGATWIFPSDMNLSDSGFGLSTINNGSFNWKIPCFSDIPGLEIVETTNAKLGLFEDNGLGFQTNGSGLIDASETFTIKKCDECLKINIDKLNIVENQEFDPGEEIWIAAFITNEGLVEIPSSPDCQIEFYWSDDTNADPEDYIENEQIGILDIGDEDVESTEFNIPNNITDGQYYIIAKLNCMTTYGEACNDSELVVPVVIGDAQVDISIKSTNITNNQVLNAGCSILTEVKVCNSGALPVDDTGLGAYLSLDNTLDSNDQLIGHYQVPTMQGGETECERNDLIIPANTANGSYFIIWVSDHDNEESESNESNNQFISSITVQNLPDLCALDLSVTPMQISGGGSIDYSFDIVNSGTVASSNTSYTIHLSTDNQLDIGDTLLESSVLGSLPSNGTISISNQLSIPSNITSGSAYIILSIDEPDSIEEKSEENNSLVKLVQASPFSLECDITLATCGGSNGAISVNAFGGTAPYTYNWSTGATSSSLSDLGADYYTVTVTDATGATNKKTEYISDNGDPKWGFTDVFSIDNDCDNRMIESNNNDRILIYCRTTNELMVYSDDGQLVLSKTYSGIKDVSDIEINNNGEIFMIGNHFAIENGVTPPPLPPLCIGCTGYFQTDWGNELIQFDPNGNLISSKTLGDSRPGGIMRPLQFNLNLTVNSIGEIFINTGSNGNVDGVFYNNTITGVYLGATNTINYSQQYLLKYDTNLDYVNHITFVANNAIFLVNSGIESIEMSDDDYLYISFYQSGGGQAPFYLSFLPYGPNGVIGYNGRRIVKLNSNLALQWIQTIEDPTTYPLSNLGFDGDNNPLLYTRANNAFGTTITGDNLFSLNKLDGTLNWNMPYISSSVIGNSNGIGLTHNSGSLEVFNSLNGSSIEQTPIIGGAIQLPLSNNPNGGFNMLIDCNTCDFGELGNFNDQLVWGVYSFDQNSTSHSINLQDCIHICEGNSIVLDAENEGLNYSWSTGSEDQTIEVSTSGKYYVTVTNDEGCFVFDSTEVKVLDVLSADATITHESCDQNNGSIQIEGSGGLAPYSYLWADLSTTSIRTNLTSGSYSLTITDSNNCSTEQTFIIENTGGVSSLEYTLKQTTCGLPNAVFQTNGFIGGSAPYQVQWQDGFVGHNRNGIAMGTYQITVTDAIGCLIEEEITVTSSSLFDLDIDQSSPTSCNAEDGTVTILPQGSNTPYTILWSDGSSQFNRSDLKADTYFITVTDSDGCKNYEQVIIAEFEIGQYQIITNPVTCEDGSIEIIPPNPNTTVSWSTGETSLQLNNLSNGQYQATISEGDGCSIAETIALTGSQSLDASINRSSNLCSEFTEVQLSISGGEPPYQVLWSNGDQTNTTNLIEGIHTVTITDDNSCELELEYEIDNTSSVSAVTFESDKTICSGESAKISLVIEGAFPPYNLVLTDGVTTNSFNNYQLGDEIDVFPLSNTTYSIIEIFDAQGCKTELSDDIFIQVNPQINFVLDLEDYFVCQGETPTVSPLVLGGTAPYTINYNDGSNLFSETNYENGQTFELDANSDKTYYFTSVEDSNGCAFSFIDIVDITFTDCQLSNNNVNDPCSCNNDQSANGAKDGTFEETISVSATSALETWTISSINPLLPSGSLPQGINVGDAMLFDGANSRHTSTFTHTDGSGFLIEVEGPNAVGNINNVTLQISNVCTYPELSSDVLASEYNLCEVGSIDLTSIISEVNGYDGQLTTYVVGSISPIFDIEDLGEGTYTIDFEFDGDFVSNANGTLANPSFPGCFTATREIVEVREYSESVVCNDEVQISLGFDCELYITPDMLLEAGADISYSILVGDTYTGNSTGLNSLFTGLNLDLENFSDTLLQYEITSSCDVSCWGYIRLENKLIPEVSCKDYFINCTDDASPGVAVPYPEFEDVAMWTSQNDDTYSIEFSILDCRNLSAQYEDVVINDCGVEDGNVYHQRIERSWTFTNNSGNTQTCSQTLFIQRLSLNEIMFPSDVSLSCTDVSDGTIQLDDEMHPAPTVSGAGIPLFPDGELCSNYLIDSEDVRLDLCGSSYKLLRTWKILDWCTGELRKENQIIEVIDDQPVIKTCPIDTLVFYTDAHRCATDVVLDPFGLVDNIAGEIEFAFDCSDFDLFVEYLTAQAGTEQPLNEPFTRVPQNTNGTFTLPNVEAGLAWVRYVFVDACGNSSLLDGGNQVNTYDDCRFEIRVIDQSKPYPVCLEFAVATIGNDGCALVNAESFDNGSWDNCALKDYRVRIKDSGDDFTPSLEFCCPEYTCGSEEQVELVVFDGTLANDIIDADYSNVEASINYNICYANITFQDDQPPVIVSTPQNPAILYCDRSISNVEELEALLDVSQFVVEDNCSTNPLFIDLSGDDFPLVSPFECGGGSFNFDWVVTNGCGQEDRHTSTIRWSEAIELSESNITYPYNVQPIHIEGCGEYDESNPISPEGLLNLHSFGGIAVADVSSLDCTTHAVSYNDLYFDEVDEDGICSKIIRTWTIIDWCSYNADTGEGQFQQSQIIKLQDNTQPNLISSYSLNCETDLLYDINLDPCRPYVKLILEASDNCTENEELVWDVIVKYCDGILGENQFDSPILSGYYSHGEVEVIASVADACGNITTSTFSVDIPDCKAPTPYCITDVTTVTLGESPSPEIWASDFNFGSYDDFAPIYNCQECPTETNELEYFLSESGSDLLEPSIDFSCIDIPNGEEALIDLQLWVIDPNGEPGYDRDFCNVTLILQDNENDLCPESSNLFADISGRIAREDGKTIPNALVTLQSNQLEFPISDMTSESGNFAFSNQLTNQEYSIIPSKNDDYLNGVSTLDIVLIQRHLLNLSSFVSPYQYIAADANNSESISASDMVAIRNLILERTEAFPNSQTSWRFVDREQSFISIDQPFPFNEEQSFMLNEDKFGQDFIGVKIGDINNSASLSEASSSEVDTRSTPLNLHVEQTSKEGSIEYIFTASNFDDILGFQFELEYPENLEFDRIIDNSLSIGEEHLSIDPQNNMLRMSWNTISAISSAEDEVLFKLVFTQKSQESVDAKLTLQDNMNAEAYTQALEVIDVTLTVKRQSDDFHLYQNTPNPFSESTLIKLWLPDDQEVELSIFDVSGKLIKYINAHYKQGENSISIEASDLPYQGIYYYQAKTQNAIQTRKMIITN